MIEWWQALLISLVSGVTSGLLTGGAALFIQRRQHGHEIAMQGQRLDAERAAEEHEAIRQMRRERLRPVFELLDELEVWYGVAIERKTLEEVRSLPPENSRLTSFQRAYRPRCGPLSCRKYWTE